MRSINRSRGWEVIGVEPDIDPSLNLSNDRRRIDLLVRRAKVEEQGDVMRPYDVLLKRLPSVAVIRQEMDPVTTESESVE